MKLEYNLDLWCQGCNNLRNFSNEFDITGILCCPKCKSSISLKLKEKRKEIL